MTVAATAPPTLLRTADHLAARVRAHAQLFTLWSERLWAEGRTSPDQGLAISSGEIWRILTDPARKAEQYTRFLAEPDTARLASRAKDSDTALAQDPFWSTLVQTFALTPRETGLLTLCLALELDPTLARVFAYLADDTRATHPTLTLAAALFGWPDTLPAPLTNLLRWQFIHPATPDVTGLLTTPWRADEALVHSILAGQWTDPTLTASTRLIPPADTTHLPCLYPSLLDQLVAAPGGDFTLSGPEGSGRQTLAAQFAAALGRPLLVIDTPSDPLPAARLAHALNAIPYWRYPESISPDQSKHTLTPISLRAGSAPDAFTLPPLNTARRMELWAHFSHATPPTLLYTQRLTPAEIKRLAEFPSSPPRRTPPSSGLIQSLPCPYTWDDLVVPPDLGRTLHDLESQILLRWQVYEDWNFARLTPLGQGISALFGGPSGTGKTMAAQVLARSLDLQLYRVDLAGVVNKYIGETEKRLREVFDACEHDGAILFFDEADALFGQRTQVKDAHDRYANIEIDYLLQRIERFDGIVLLATNRQNDLDPAFLRRLRFVVDFLNPDQPQRRLLWQKALPAHTPSGERITGALDFETLARTLELTGAQIKSIALNAAFLARNAGTLIEMPHLELAAQREYAKQGLMLPTTFSSEALR